jgi:hypothetical protein
MLEFAKTMMNRYQNLIVKMTLDFVSNNFTKMNFELLCDIEVLYGLTILLPLLKEVNLSVKIKWKM